MGSRGTNLDRSTQYYILPGIFAFFPSSLCCYTSRVHSSPSHGLKGQATGTIDICVVKARNLIYMSMEMRGHKQPLSKRY